MDWKNVDALAVIRKLEKIHIVAVSAFWVGMVNVAILLFILIR